MVRYLRQTVCVVCTLCVGAAAYVPGAAALAPVRLGRSAAAAAVVMEEGAAKLGLGLMPKQKTWMPKASDMAMENKKWFVVDAEGMRLGRMASEVAKLLLGKHKPIFTPGADIGDCVVIVNAEKIIITGNKAQDKLYRRHSGRPGGMTIESYEELQKRIPERIVEKAIKGMLPKNSHGRNLFRHLHVYKGPTHPHAAQTPEALTFGGASKRSQLTVTPDSQVMDLTDPDAIQCAV